MPTLKQELEIAHISNLIAHLNDLKQNKANTPKMSRLSEIIKLKHEVNKIETKKIIQRISETKNWFLAKIYKIDKLLFK